VVLDPSAQAKIRDRRPVFRVQNRKIPDWFLGIPDRMDQNLSRLEQILQVLYYQILA
jgi:hypothetical protein